MILSNPEWENSDHISTTSSKIQTKHWVNSYIVTKYPIPSANSHNLSKGPCQKSGFCMRNTADQISHRFLAGQTSQNFSRLQNRIRFLYTIPLSKDLTTPVRHSLHNPWPYLPTDAGVCIYEFISLLAITSYSNSLCKMCCKNFSSLRPNFHAKKFYIPFSIWITARTSKLISSQRSSRRWQWA